MRPPLGMRLLGGWSNSSKETCRRPPPAEEKRSNSDLIQLRAAPMPRVGEEASESVWRVPKEASFSTIAWALAGSIADVIAAMVEAGSVGARGGDSGRGKNTNDN